MRRGVVPVIPSFPDDKPQGVEVFDNRNYEGLKFLHTEIETARAQEESKVKESRVKESIEKESAERERKEEKSASDIFPPSPPVLSPSDVVSCWNDKCQSLPQVLKLTEARRAKVKKRIAEFGKTREQQQSIVDTLFRKINGSAFLLGNNNNNWTATFDWVFDNDKNWVKVMEGNYDDKKDKNNKIPVVGITTLCEKQDKKYQQ